jgi:hypothetical protein
MSLLCRTLKTIQKVVFLGQLRGREKDVVLELPQGFSDRFEILSASPVFRQTARTAHHHRTNAVGTWLQTASIQEVMHTCKTVVRITQSPYRWIALVP